MLQLENVVSVVEGIADKRQLHWRDFGEHEKLDANIALRGFLSARTARHVFHHIAVAGRANGLAISP
jgi:hypothetical protein